MYIKLKLNYLLVLLLIISIAVSNCVIAGSTESYEDNGVTFEYPDDWEKVNSNSEGAVAAIAFKNDTNTNIIIQEIPSILGSNVQQAYTNNYNNFSKNGNYKVLKEANTTVNGRSALLNRYVVTSDNGEKEHIACWMQMNNNKKYVVLFTTTVENYDSQKEVFDAVINSFKV